MKKPQKIPAKAFKSENQKVGPRTQSRAPVRGAQLSEDDLEHVAGGVSQDFSNTKRKEGS